MTQTLLSLPLEVHRAIFELLVYPDLARLRATCQGLRHVDVQDITKGALLQIEKDWADTVFAVEENKVSEGRIICKQVILESWGYDIHDTGEIEVYLPCYKCLQLRKLVAHFSSEHLSVLAKHAQMLTLSYQQRLQASASRRCIDCVLQSSDYLEESGGRWLCVRPGLGTSRPGRYWLAICRTCNRRVESIRPPPERRRHSDLCSPCFEKSYPEWFQIQHELQSRVDTLQQQLTTINQQVKILGRCSSWMAKVDNGESVLDNRPKELDQITMPKWEEIRPDAIVHLPKAWKWLR